MPFHMHSSVSLHQVTIESHFLRLDDIQSKIVQVVGEVALTGILRNC